MGGDLAVAPAPDPSANDLDDELDRDELRQRYYGLLQEVRVLLPGVQILVAFLLTIPFDCAFPNSTPWAATCTASRWGAVSWP